LACWIVSSKLSTLQGGGERRSLAPPGSWPPPADAPAGRSVHQIVPTSSPESGGRACRVFPAGNNRKSARGRVGGNAEGHPGRVRSA
jgi:hypothetical protein